MKPTGGRIRATQLRIAIVAATLLVVSAVPLPNGPPVNAAAPGVPPILVKVPRHLMPLAFALDAASSVKEFFAPHRYTASFGDPIDVQTGATTSIRPT